MCNQSYFFTGDYSILRKNISFDWSRQCYSNFFLGGMCHEVGNYKNNKIKNAERIYDSSVFIIYQESGAGLDTRILELLHLDLIL